MAMLYQSIFSSKWYSIVSLTISIIITFINTSVNLKKQKNKLGNYQVYKTVTHIAITFFTQYSVLNLMKFYF